MREIREDERDEMRERSWEEMTEDEIDEMRERSWEEMREIRWGEKMRLDEREEMKEIRERRW